MIRLCNVYLPSRLFAFILIDGAILLILGLAAFHSDISSAHLYPDTNSLLFALLVGAVLLWTMYLFDLYDLDLKAGWQDAFTRCLRALGCAVLLLVPVWWFMAPRGIRYQQLEICLLIFMLLFSIYRLIAETVRNTIFPGERLLLIGNGPVIDLLTGALKQRFSLPIKLSAVIQDQASDSTDGPPAALHFAACGTLDDVDKVCETFKPHRVAVGMQEYGDTLPGKLLQLRRRGIRVEDAATFYEALSGRVPVRQVDMRSMAFGTGFKPNTITYSIYRFCGLMIALIIAILFSPMLLAIAIAIKLDSPGPVFYSQERVGMNGETFRAFKFRSMRTDAEATSGPVWAEQNDPRVTRVGRILRKLRLDEFAQIYNVLRGEMCLVGPRPERPHFTAILAETIPFYDVRHSVPPGITGWAQVNASYGASMDESRIKLEYDLFYLKNQSPLLDALIIFKTIKIALFGRGAR